MLGLHAGRVIDGTVGGLRDLAQFSGAARRLAARRADGRPDAVLVWVPKTAGTSLWDLLEANGGRKYTERHELDLVFPQRGIATFGHADYRALVAEGAIDRAFDARAFRFAVVRDPFERAVSLYEYLRGLERLPALLSFARFAAMLRDGEYEPLGTYHSWGLSQCNPQVAWLVAPDGSDVVDQVYRYEDLAAAVADLRRRLGLVGDLRRLNVSERRDPAAYYASAAVRRDIAAAYAADFERFAYDA